MTAGPLLAADEWCDWQPVEQTALDFLLAAWQHTAPMPLCSNEPECTFDTVDLRRSKTKAEQMTVLTMMKRMNGTRSCKVELAIQMPTMCQLVRWVVTLQPQLTTKRMRLDK